MITIKRIYFKNLIADLFAHKKVVGLMIVLFATIFAAIGYIDVQKSKVLIEEKTEDIIKYEERIEEYNSIVEDVETSLEIVSRQVDEFEDYVNNSIYMKLDPQNIQVASVQYAIEAEGNIGNILNSIFLYINEGGLKEDLGEVYGVADGKYWREIIFPSNTGNILNITVYHYDTEKVREIIEVVKEKVLKKIPELEKSQGKFVLHEQGTSYYTKADPAVMNNQNTHLNNVKNYRSNRADFENKLITQKNARTIYVEKNAPKQEDVSQEKIIAQVMKYTLVGVCFGVVSSISVVFLSYILGNRIRKKEDLRDSGLNVIAAFNIQNGYAPQLDRIVLDLKLLISQYQWNKVYFNVLIDDEWTRRVVNDLQVAVSAEGISVFSGYRLDESADELKQMLACQNCLFIAEVGKTTYSQLEQQLKLCQRLNIQILGCVIIE